MICSKHQLFNFYFLSGNHRISVEELWRFPHIHFENSSGHNKGFAQELFSASVFFSWGLRGGLPELLLLLRTYTTLPCQPSKPQPAHRSSRHETPRAHSNRNSPPTSPLLSLPLELCRPGSVAPGLGEGTELTYGFLCIVRALMLSTLALLHVGLLGLKKKRKEKILDQSFFCSGPSSRGCFACA